MNLFQSFDISIFDFFSDLSGRAEWSDTAIIFLATHLPYLVVLLVAWAAYSEFRGGRMARFQAYCIAVIAGLIARFGVAELIRFFYHRPRPFVVLDVPNLLTEISYSFPSGHTIFFFALATGIFLVNKRFGGWLFAAALLIGFARVTAGVHYPSDIIGGALLGAAIGYLVHICWRKLSA